MDRGISHHSKARSALLALLSWRTPRQACFYLLQHCLFIRDGLPGPQPEDSICHHLARTLREACRQYLITQSQYPESPRIILFLKPAVLLLLLSLAKPTVQERHPHLSLLHLPVEQYLQQHLASGRSAQRFLG
jgi:hypothetical protein